MNAYTIKKMLPRLIIAVIAVNLSWYIATGLLNVASIIGGATRGILLAPFAGFESIFSQVAGRAKGKGR